jgi:DNA-binding Xre family transcriptional regulator
MKILCEEKTTGRTPKKDIKELKDKLSKFYKKNYKPLCQKEQLDYTYMNTIHDYLTIDILTIYENNIKQYYIEYVERYVNVIWIKKEMIKFIRKFKKTKQNRISTINKLCAELRKIKNDLLNIDGKDYKSNKRYHE